VSLKVESTCPLGSTCEEVKDGKIHRCAWYTKIVGKNPQSEEQIEDWACAIAWLPMLQVEMSQTNRGQTHALESFRNETVKGQAVFNSLVEKRNNILENKQ
jgi:hypothetical protein